MKGFNKHKGFTLIEIAIVIAFLSILAIGGIKVGQSLARDSSAQVVKSRIEYVMDTVDRYYMHRVSVDGVGSQDPAAFPPSVAALQSTGFIPPCAPAQAAAGLCIDYGVIPFTSLAGGQPITLASRLSGAEPLLDISFPLSTITTDDLRVAVIAALSSIPGFTIDGSDNVTIVMQRPGQLAQLAGFVKTDGTEEMIADWNTGPHDINVGGDLSSSNLSTGNVSATTVGATGAITSGTNITATGTVSGQTLDANGNVIAGNDFIGGRNLVLNGTADIAGNVDADGWLTVDGKATFNADAEVKNNLGVRGNSVVDGTSTVGGNSSVGGSLTVSQNATVNNNLAVNGSASVQDGVNLNDSLIDNTGYLFGIRDGQFVGVTDRTLLSGLRSTGSLTFDGHSYRSVSKPTCPAGYTARIEVWTISVGYRFVLIEPSNVQLWTESSGSTWRVRFRVYTRVNYTTNSRQWRYEGQVGYTTWCSH
ncbi:prepilin-type N-terminal cleavage/methylation domain-containing protein [Vibrio owensii]|uniref:prepilin-type N-terminal cleavage/methylation domain-containing protein n=1 Tax=Vibrio owensii TaxID=696485 RepID=UPI0018F16A35|nr:prepilin-type N-terminal cleavage/methylation domain-containing protein [Vibrio owensii]